VYVCDFCSSPDPRWSYPTASFVFRTELIDHASDGAWAACDACRSLIECNDHAGLTDRSLTAWRSVMVDDVAPEEEAMLHQMLAALHEAFWRERLGPSYPKK
jgi:hypothetical protein